MSGWHHRCKEHELGQTLRDGEGQGCLAYCRPGDCKELDMHRQLNNNSHAGKGYVVSYKIRYAWDYTKF